MKRRDFARAAGLGVAAAVISGKVTGTQAGSGGNKKIKMRLGSQRRANDDGMLAFLVRHGVEGVCGFPKLTGKRSLDYEDLMRSRDRIETHGLTLDLCSFGLTSAGIEKQVFPNILLGLEPERDRDIERISEIIRVAARGQVPCLKYNLAIHPVLRTEPSPGRGGANYSTWDCALAADRDKIHAVAGVVPHELFWERITYFLEHIIPVAEEYKMRMACHPHDPGVPMQGYQGIYRVLGDVDGLKKFVDIVDSKYHGLNLCLGTVSEMLHEPAKELPDIITYFGQRGKIFNIHFRNIIGHRDKFMESYVDNGDVDMFTVMQILNEVDYPYLVMPDHVPFHKDDPEHLQAYAHAFGYIKAMLQAVAHS